MRKIYEEIRLNRAIFAGHIIRMEMCKLTRRLYKTGRNRRNTGTKWVVEMKKDWSGMTIRMEKNPKQICTYYYTGNL